MATPLTTRTKRGQLADYDGVAVGVLVVDATGAAAAATTMVYVSAVTANEIDTGDAPGYARGTIDMLYTQDGETGIWDMDPAGTPYSTDMTGATPAGVWFYDTTGGSDAARELIAFLPIEPGAGFDGWTISSPTDGVARVKVEEPELEARVTSLEDRTVPDAADGDPDQVWTTDGAIGYWADPSGGVAPVEVTAAEFATGVWTITIPATDGTAYIIDDYATDDDHGLTAIIPDGTTPGSFRVVVRPQTGDGPTSLNLSDGAALVAFDWLGVSIDGNVLADGAVFDWANDGNGWTVASSSVDFSSFTSDPQFQQAVASSRFVPFCGYGFDGGGTVSFTDTSRSGDDPGFYLPDDPSMLTVTGQTMPGTGVAVVAVRNQPGVEPTGFFEWGHVGEEIDGEVVTAAMFGSPAPTTGDAILKRTITLNGRWKSAQLFSGSQVDIGELNASWRLDGDGMTADLIDGDVSITTTGFSGSLASLDPVDKLSNALTLIDGISGGGGSVATDAIYDAKGDLPVGTGANTAAKLSVGANDTMPVADSAEATGIKWAAPSVVRTALGLVIGTNVQAFDTELTAVAAGTATAANMDTLQLGYGSSVVPHLGPTSTNGTWALSTSGGNGPHVTNSSVASGDWIEWARLRAGGTYTLGLLIQQGTSGGQYQVAIDGANVGSTIEGYAGSTTLVRDVTTVTGQVLTPGLHTIRVTSSAKHASSSGYGIRILAMWLTRTA